ncbi:MAG: hypothetical protein NTV34_02510 [Proteobacteria bacterium]|nr:hypothetical protein [Pseudomonadota bacterium]
MKRSNLERCAHVTLIVPELQLLKQGGWHGPGVLPLYEFQGLLKPLVENVLGLAEPKVRLINHDRVGKALDDFYAGKHKDVFFHPALKATNDLQISMGRRRVKI